MYRVTLSAIVACLLQVAVLPNGGSSPAVIGNRANHFSYQPTPGEVDGRERSMGVRPTDTQQQATDRRLEQLDRSLLRAEGSSTDTVPKMQTR
jgi:hypothetical protein